MKQIQIPTEIREAVAKGAVLAISISGGKDSQALLKAVMDWYRAEGLTNKVFAIHADLGRVEWKQTPQFVEKICKDLDVELVVVRRERNGKTIDLLDRWIERKEQLAGQNKPFWSSAMARYCTSDLKADPINRYLRQFDNVISIEGIRWQESKARSEKPRWKVRTEIATKGRKALTWNAIIDFTIDDVWATYNQDRGTLISAQLFFSIRKFVPYWWNFHPAYAMGNQRLSCAICVLGNMNDVINGVKHNPEIANEMEKLEIETGFTFKQNFSITDAKKRLQAIENQTVIS